MFAYLAKYAPENFYTWMDSCFKIVGLRLPDDKKKECPYFLVAISHYLMSTFLVTCLEGTELYREFGKDFKASMLTLSLFTLHSVFIFRAIFWALTKEKLAKVVDMVQRDSFDFSCFGIYKMKYEHLLNRVRDFEKGKALEYDDLKKLWSNAKIFVNDDKNFIEQFRKQKMAQTRAICCFIYIGINILSILTISVSYINVLGVKYEEFNGRYNVTSTYRPYPYYMYFPFDTSVSHGFYWVGFFYQLYAYCSAMLTFLPLDTIIVNSIIHLISQTIIVGEAFNKLGDNMDYTQGKETVTRLHEIRLVKCITELQNIYRAVYLLEDLCNIQLLVQYGASVFILCSLCYVIPLVDDVGEFICRFIFLLATLGEIFVLTYCSQTLSLELQNATKAVYNLTWPSYPGKLRRDVIFLISRLQKPSVLTAGKIFTLDLLFFIQVTQKSYSFYTLISNTSK